jgi:hypothetical protein
MLRRGHTGVVAYLDDYICINSTFEGCQKMLLDLMFIVRKLGFWINYKKVVGPTQCITFLGIVIDSLNMEIRLPDDKLAKCKASLDHLCGLTRASKKQLQHIIGLLNWAAGAINGGRVYLRRLIALCNSIKHRHGRAKLDGPVRQDLQWWLCCINIFNGKSLIPSKMPITTVMTDACNTGGAGVFQGDWFYCNWELDWPEFKNHHINYKEILAILLAAYRWGPMWAGKRIIVYTDNMVAIAAINKAKCKCTRILQGLRVLFWLSVKYNFHISAFHIPGVRNFEADLISRLLDLRYCKQFLNIYPVYKMNVLFHMSYNSAVSVFRGCFPTTGIG